MIRSMTGYGRTEKSLDQGMLTIEMQALNKKSLDIVINLPKCFSPYESEFKEILIKKLFRGRISVFVDFAAAQNQGQYQVNHELAIQYFNALEELKNKVEINAEISLKDLLSNKELINYQNSGVVSEEILEQAKTSLSETMDKLIDMRQKEGDCLHDDFKGRIKFIELTLSEIESLAPESIKRYEDRLRTRLTELFPTKEELDIRLLREVALMADRIDITEEIVRIKSHLKQFGENLNKNGAVGRLLDFIIQELMREINTVGSKSDHIKISKNVVLIKNELDKMREQVQNVE